MLRPCGPRPRSESSKLGFALCGLGLRLVGHGGTPGQAVSRVDIARDVAANLPKHGTVAAKDGGALRQGFGERQAVALCEGREQQGPGAFQQTGNGGVANARGLVPTGCVSADRNQALEGLPADGPIAA